MSRFFVASSSGSDDGYEEEEEQIQEEIEEAPTPSPQESSKSSKFSSFFDWNKGDSGKRVVHSEKSKRWAELRQLSEAIFDQFHLGFLKKSFECFQKLQKGYDKAQKAIAENGHPNFFIRQMGELVQLVTEGVKKEKDLRRFADELKTFTEPFDDLLEEFRKNPEEFEDKEEEEDDDMESGDNDDEDDDSDSGWFVSSESEDEAVADTKASEKPKERRVKEMTTAEAVEARIQTEQDKKIDDESAKAELEKYKMSREKGKIIAVTSRLSVLMENVIDEALGKEIQLEIVHTMTLNSSDQPIPIDDWNLALTILPELEDEFRTVVPLLERLDKDFWARSVDPKHLFTPDVTKLHQIIPKFLNILKSYSKKLHEMGDVLFYVRVELIILNHLYSKNSEDVMPIAMSIIKTVCSNEIFDQDRTIQTKIRAAILLATNLAIRNYPIDAAELIARLPAIPENMVIEKILFNRAKVHIGLVAFKFGLYRLAYECLNCFENIYRNGKSRHHTDKFKDVKEELGQATASNIYPPWMCFDPADIIACSLLSSMILDLPNLTASLEEGGAIIINAVHHRFLMKLPSVVHPENLDQRVAVCIANIKIGEWQKAIDAISFELKKNVTGPETFKYDLRKMSLCCFLLTANNFYDSISYEFLTAKFELSMDETRKVVNDMIDGKSTIDVVPARLLAKTTEDGKYLVFERPVAKSSLVDYEKEIEKKIVELKKKVDDLSVKV